MNSIKNTINNQILASMRSAHASRREMAMPSVSVTSDSLSTGKKTVPTDSVEQFD